MTKNQDFIRALERLYGNYDYNSALFGSSNYSKISKDLCYSNSHFSKLISGGATDPMYDRALNNIKRLQKLADVKKQLELKAETSQFNSKSLLWKIAALVLGISTIFLFYNQKSDEKKPVSGTHPLDIYFDFNDAHYYKSPYLSEEQVHQYCPGSAFEGRWKLADKYVIPIPYKIPGLYYVGSNADIRLKCLKTSKENKGKELIGFENIENEIWFDQTLTNIDFNMPSQELSTNLNSINFENDKNYIKIASVYSCFYDEIVIANDSIQRKGEPCGRYANAENEEVLKEYNLDLNHIIEYIIGNMIFAQCSPMENIFCDPNDLQNGQSLLTFDCTCSLKEGGSRENNFRYTKSMKLIEQNYQSNLSCNCE